MKTGQTFSSIVWKWLRLSFSFSWSFSSFFSPYHTYPLSYSFSTWSEIDFVISRWKRKNLKIRILNQKHTQKKEESILLLNLPSIFWKWKERKKERKKKAGLNWIWGYVCTGNRSNEGLQVVRTRGGKRTWRKRGGLRNKFSQMVSVSWIVESHSFCFDWPPLFFSLFFFFSNSPVYPSLELLKRKRFSQFPFTTFSRK